MAATPPPDLLTTAQVARLLRRSVPTVIRMAGDGRLEPAHKLPGTRGAYLFARQDVDALLSADGVAARAS